MSKTTDFFFKHLVKNPHVVEIGTRRWDPKRPTHHRAQFPDALEYVMVDYMEGQDVDVVWDIHKLSERFQNYDAIYCASVFEHLYAPWIAAEQICKTLKPGGVFYVQTHFVFPEHGYPHDYFRYTTLGLEALFKNFCREVVTEYEFPGTLTPHDKSIPWNPMAPVYLNVNIAGITK